MTTPVDVAGCRLLLDVFLLVDFVLVGRLGLAQPLGRFVERLVLLLQLLLLLALGLGVLPGLFLVLLRLLGVELLLTRRVFRGLLVGGLLLHGGLAIGLRLLFGSLLLRLGHLLRGLGVNLRRRR